MQAINRGAALKTQDIFITLAGIFLMYDELNDIRAIHSINQISDTRFLECVGHKLSIACIFFLLATIKVAGITLWLLSMLLISTQASAGGSPFSDEFNQSVDLLNNNTSGWSVLGSGFMDERATEITMSSGLLTVVPESFNQNAWFQDQYGPLVYQPVTGNFAVAISLRVSQANDTNLPPAPGFNAGGFVIRDPIGTHNGDENWLMYNMGGQGQGGVTYAREMKKTVNSTSNLYLTEQVGLEEYLLACRVGDVFYFYYWADAIADWRQETFYNQFDVDGTITTTWRNSGSVTPEITVPISGQASPMHFNHPAMPPTVQLGIMGHTWINNINGIRADFDFVRFAANPPESQADCIAEFMNIDQGNDLIFADGFEIEN